MGTAVLPSSLDGYQEAARKIRDATKNKAYRAYPLGQEAGAYLRYKRGVLTKASYDAYETALDKLARWFPDLELADFEPPMGTERIEEFLDHHWGEAAPATYNVRLSTMRDFFKWAQLKGKIHGDPTLAIKRHKKRDVYRTTFPDEAIIRLIESQDGDGDQVRALRDRCCLRLLLDYGIRKGALRNVQLKHFDHSRRRLTIFSKGGKVRQIPIPDPGFWADLGRVIVEWELATDHYLLCNDKMIWRGYEKGSERVHRPDRQMGNNGAHAWWYRCLERAGIVEEGVRSGEKMHKARHTAGQRVLDATKGNLKAAQALLGHADIGTTADTYVDWSIDQLEETMREVLES